MAKNSEIDTSYLDRTPDHGGAGGYVATAVLAAAVGAGVALLFAPEKGTKTRKKLNRRLQALELGAKLATVPGVANAGIEYVQHRVRRKAEARRRKARMLGLAGTVAGIALTTMLAPQGEEIRRKVRETSDRMSSSMRRARNGSHMSSFDEASADEQRPVRTVQELGREPETVF